MLSGIELASSRSWPRGARYFCLDTKVSKKSSQQIGFFALTNSTAPPAFALKSGQNHGLQLFCPAALALSQCFCKNLLCPFLRSRPPLFCPLSSEAYLLTGTFFIYYVMGSLSKHSGLGLCARPFDGLRLTSPLCHLTFRVHGFKHSA